MKTRLDRLAEADEQNIEAAQIIAAEPERYAGLPLLWAEMTLQRHGKLFLVPEEVIAA